MKNMLFPFFFSDISGVYGLSSPPPRPGVIESSCWGRKSRGRREGEAKREEGKGKERGKKGKGMGGEEKGKGEKKGKGRGKGQGK